MEEKELKGFQKLRKDLKGMTFKEKVDHLWTYYRWVIIVVFMSCLLISLLASTYINANTHTILSGLYINVTPDETAKQYLQTDFQAIHTTGVKWEDMILKEVTLEDKNKTNDLEAYTYTITSIHSLFAAQSVDYIITDQLGLESVWPTDQAEQAFVDLREFLTEEELKTLTEQGKMLYVGGLEEGIPMAVEISHLPIIKEHFGTDKLVFFSVITNSTRKDMTRTFWEYLNAWETTN